MEGPTLQSISVTPGTPTVPKGLTQQFTAMGNYSDNSMKDLTTTATWSSSDGTVATISNSSGTKGLATTMNSGPTTIQAQFGSVNGSTILTVSNVSLSVMVVGPQNPSIADAGTAQAFTATGHFSDGTTQDLSSSANWTSSNTSVATMSGAIATSKTLAGGVSAGFTSIQAAMGAVTGVAILSVTNHSGNGFAGVFTQHNDIARTGLNANENVLTLTNVGNTTTFGKKFSQSVDGFLYAQPLYVPSVSIAGGTHNVVIVATEGDSVYAFDADNKTGANANPLWHANLIDTAHGASAGETTATSNDVSCTDLVPEIGISSTPVIDPSTGTIYVETKSKQPSGLQFFHRLHALDIATGTEKFGGPAVISASVSATGDGSSGGTLKFNDLTQMNRPGLLWLNGMIYVAYASPCDNGPYHGWVFAYDAATLAQKALHLTTPNGGLGGIWMSGAGLAADSAGNIYLTTGNGTFDTSNIPAQELGDTDEKLFNDGTDRLALVDYFTPFNQASLSNADTDLGSGGVLLLPHQPGAHAHELVQVGKEGKIYVIDRDHMTAGNLHYCVSACNGTDAQIVQELNAPIPIPNGIWSMPAYWNNNVYFWGVSDVLKRYTLSNGLLGVSPASTSSRVYGYPGANPSLSASATTNAIVWAIDSNGGSNAGLYAYDAITLVELYNSNQASGNRDVAGPGVKFSVPTIANGKVYVGTQTEVDVYGTLP